MADQRAQGAQVEALRKERDKARLLKEGLEADQAKLKAKERELAMRLKDKDRALAVKAVGESLVAKFLEADRDHNWDDQEALKGPIEAFLKDHGAGGGNKAGAFPAAVYGGGIDEYLNEVYAMSMAGIGIGEGRNNDGNDSSTASGGGYLTSDDDDEEEY